MWEEMMEVLHRNIVDLLTTYTGRWGVVIVDPLSGYRLAINPEMVFPAASLIKVPILYEILRQAAAGLLRLDDSHVVTKAVRAGGAGILKELRPDITMTIRELAMLMIILSDNTATNMLLELTGMDRINESMTNLGLQSTVLRRRMMDVAAAQAGNENETSAADLALLFTAIQTSVGLPPEYSAVLLDILMRQQIRDKLPFYLPDATVLAHKTGTLPGVEHDVGILFSPRGPVIVCVLAAGLAANYHGVQGIACIGKVVYEHFQGL
jgi:beta-lactamase class A